MILVQLKYKMIIILNKQNNLEITDMFYVIKNNVLLALSIKPDKI